MRIKFTVISFLILLILNLGIAKDIYYLDFSKEPMSGNLIYEISKGVKKEKEDSSYHLALVRPESFLRLYTPVSKDLIPFRVILKIYLMTPLLPYAENWTPIEILVNDKSIVRGWDIGSNIYISPSFDITSYWLKGATNKVEIKLEKDANGELWLKSIEIIVYER
ncbi:MAG: hypothetical protein N2312_00280 [Dictyoglomaceae bacterium]|nr:hypothetical protein [Dictyoglomaceae bacterium]